MGCTVTLPRMEGGRPRYSRADSSGTRNTENDDGMQTRASSANITTEDDYNGKNGARDTIVENVFTREKSRGFHSGYGRHRLMDEVKESELEEPYLTEDMVMDFADRSIRSSGTKEEELMVWVSQIPPGLPDLDPLECHQASMAELRQLQEEKKREMQAASPRKRKNKS